MIITMTGFKHTSTMIDVSPSERKRIRKAIIAAADCYSGPERMIQMEIYYPEKSIWEKILEVKDDQDNDRSSERL